MDTFFLWEDVFGNQRGYVYSTCTGACNWLVMVQQRRILIASYLVINQTTCLVQNKTQSVDVGQPPSIVKK